MGSVQKQTDPLNDQQKLTIVMVGILVLFMAWYFFHGVIMYYVIKGFIYLQYPFALILDDARRLYIRMIDALKHHNILGIATIYYMSKAVGNYYRWISFGICMVTAYIALKHPLMWMSRKMNTQSFLEFQSKTWKSICPIVYTDLLRGKNIGWDPSLSTHEYISKKNLIHKKSGDVLGIEKLLISQLGEKMKDINSLPDYQKALAVIFAQRILRIKKNNKIVGKITMDILNESTIKKTFCFDPKLIILGEKSKPLALRRAPVTTPWEMVANLRHRFINYSNKEPDYHLVIDSYKKLMSAPEVKEVIRGFSYSKSMLANMLFEARKYDGILSSSDFLWLKPVDRSLWYALDRISTNQKLPTSSFVEGIGIVSQWQSEVIAKRYMSKMTKPCVVNGIIAILIELEKVGDIDLSQVYDNKLLNDQEKIDAIYNNIIRNIVINN